jgi:hypothetical protein
MSVLAFYLLFLFAYSPLEAPAQDDRDSRRSDFCTDDRGDNPRRLGQILFHTGLYEPVYLDRYVGVCHNHPCLSDTPMASTRTARTQRRTPV